MQQQSDHLAPFGFAEDPARFVFASEQRRAGLRLLSPADRRLTDLGRWPGLRAGSFGVADFLGENKNAESIKKWNRSYLRH